MLHHVLVFSTAIRVHFYTSLEIKTRFYCNLYLFVVGLFSQHQRPCIIAEVVIIANQQELKNHPPTLELRNPEACFHYRIVALPSDHRSMNSKSLAARIRASVCCCSDRGVNTAPSHNPLLCCVTWLSRGHCLNASVRPQMHKTHVKPIKCELHINTMSC